MTTPLDPYGYIPSMASIHQVFRHAAADAQALVESVGPGDRERCELVGSYLDNVWRLLHVHHEGEDEYLTPRLVERGTADEAAEATHVAAEHQTLLRRWHPHRMRSPPGAPIPLPRPLMHSWQQTPG